MAGDMVSRSDTDHHVFFKLAETLPQRYPCYYVIGNHEQNMEHNELKAFLAQLGSMGIGVMDNEKVDIIKENQRINLYGMSFPLKYSRNPTFGHRPLLRLANRR